MLAINTYSNIKPSKGWPKSSIKYQLKIECCVNGIVKRLKYKKSKNLNKAFLCDLLRLKEDNTWTCYLIKFSLKGMYMYLCLHFFARLFSVVVFDINNRLVYFKAHIKHVSIMWSTLNLKSDDRIPCNVLFCCIMPLSMHTV